MELITILESFSHQGGEVLAEAAILCAPPDAEDKSEISGARREEDVKNEWINIQTGKNTKGICKSLISPLHHIIRFLARLRHFTQIGRAHV